MQSYIQHSRSLLASTLLMAGLLAVLVQAPVAWAGHSICRTDPVVTLSNGVIVTMTEDIEADPSAVQGINYTLSAPRGTTITRIDYYGPIAPALQHVTLVANQDDSHYHTQTNVQAETNAITVIATLQVGTQAESETGHTNGVINLDVDN